jgi:hypothetical protein
MTVIRPIDYYLTTIAKLTPDFTDDGLSFFPDWIYRLVLRHDLAPAGRVHDWHYCTRCHRSGGMNQARRKFADLALRRHARELLHGHFHVAPLVLYAGVRWFGGGEAWNSCGPTRGERCRHNMRAPSWMR